MISNDNERDMNMMAEVIYGHVRDWMREGVDPFAIAAMLSTTGLRIYRSALDDEAYERMVAVICDKKNNIESFVDPRSLQ